MNSITPFQQQALAAPFTDEEVDWRPGAVSQKDNKALALAYVDARTVMDRLDLVLGVGGWRTSYRAAGVAGDAVICKLEVWNGTEWIGHEDVGTAGEGRENKLKSAWSDSLKRCAIHFGVGRYLYSFPRNQWLPLDQSGKRFDNKFKPAIPPQFRYNPKLLVPPTEADKGAEQKSRDLVMYFEGAFENVESAAGLKHVAAKLGGDLKELLLPEDMKHVRNLYADAEKRIKKVTASAPQQPVAP